MLRFMGTRVDNEDLADAKPGRMYFAVREGRKTAKPGRSTRKKIRLHSLPPKTLGDVPPRGRLGPAVRRDLLGVVMVFEAAGEKQLRTAPEDEALKATQEATQRAAELDSRSTGLVH
jgi:hypothetical protein